MVALRPRTLVELGAGSADKTRELLDAMVYAGSGEVYVPIDVSAEFLDDTAARLRGEYPTLGIEPVVGDIADPLDLGPDLPRPALIAFLGSTIGNFDASEAGALLENVARAMSPGDRFLLGADLRKHPSIENLLVSTDDQMVSIPGVGEVAFAGGESIRTEISCKYDRASLARMLGDAGMVIERWITDSAQTYALVVAALARDGSTAA